MEQYRLIDNQSSSSEKEARDSLDATDEDLASFQRTRYLRENGNLFVRTFGGRQLLIAVAVFSLVANVFFGILSVYLVRNLKSDGKKNAVSFTASPYAGLSPDPAARFPWSVGYGPEITNHSLADERWEALDINPGVVAIPDEWATEHNLPPTQRFPWDPSKGVYTLSAFHTLHCLKNIHRLLYDAHHGRPLSRDVGHAMHCVDHMRKDAMCSADDFLLPTPPDHYGMAGPRGQARVCRNWDALLAWAHQHHACYEHVTDDEAGFAESHREIERYRNCPKDSPYFETMRKHFEEM